MRASIFQLKSLYAHQAKNCSFFLQVLTLQKAIAMLFITFAYLEELIALSTNALLALDDFQQTMSPLEFVGILTVLYFTYEILFQLLITIYFCFIKTSLKGDILLKEKGRWAVVTGATDGIGKAYANRLAAKGIHIALLSRDIKKLNDCAGDIEAKHNVQTKVIAVDFTKGIEIYDEIERALSDLEIGILINNVGVSYSYPEFFLDIPDKNKLFSAIVRANIVSVTKMCEIVMPGMVRRKSGIVVNISSAAAMVPSPMLTVYAASKSYVEKFSNELRHEYASQGLTIQTVLPGYVATKMSKIRRSTLMVPSADLYVQSALGKLGMFDHTNGYIPHTVLVHTLLFLYSCCPPLFIRFVTRSMKNVRERALMSHKKKVSEE